MSSSFTAPRRRVLTASVVTILAALLLTPAAAQSALQTVPGNPLTIHTGDLGQLQSQFVATPNANFFPPNSPIGDAGFFLAFPSNAPASVASDVYGFDGFAGPFGLFSYTPVSNGPPTGSGTAASPHQNVTVYRVPIAAGNLQITQTISYVNGSGTFAARYDVTNNTAGAVPFRALFAGDLYNANDDRGTGVFSAGPPRFIGGANPASGVLGGFTEVLPPPWTHYQEAFYSTIWAQVEGAATNPAFNDTVDPTFLDNGAGVQWDTVCGPMCPGGAGGPALGAGLTQTFLVNTLAAQPGPLTLTPPAQNVTQGQNYSVTATARQASGEPYAGERIRFVVTGANPQARDVNANGAGQSVLTVTAARAGTDTITAFIDFNRNNVREPSTEPQVTATATIQPSIATASGVRISPSAFYAARSGPSAKSSGRRRQRRTFGAIVTYNLNRAANVTFTVQRASKGRRNRSGRCVAQRRSNRRAKRCNRYVNVRGSFTRAGAAGRNRFRFMGRMSGRTLRRGSYRLVLTPTVGTVRGRPTTKPFRIKKP